MQARTPETQPIIPTTIEMMGCQAVANEATAAAPVAGRRRGRAAASDRSVHERPADVQLAAAIARDVGDRRGMEREKARLQLVQWFDVCPDPAVVSRGRRYLGMYLN